MDGPSSSSPSGVPETSYQLVFESIRNTLPQIKSSLDQAKNLNIPISGTAIGHVVVAGMGGSAFPGEALQTFLSSQLLVPLAVIRDYHLPAFINQKTLLILSSYSGSTEETLSCAEEAVKNSIPVIGLTSGGRLSEFLAANQKPCLTFAAELNPAGQPRLGWGFSLGGTWGILAKAGLCPWPQLPEKITEAEFDLERIGEKIIILAGAGMFAGALRGMRNVINETGKNYADYHVLPELNHHLMEGLSFPKSNYNNLYFLFVESQFYEPAIRRRMELTQQVVKNNSIDSGVWRLTGATPEEQLLEIMVNGCLLATRLAQARGIDPIKTPWVDWFKAQLASDKG